MLSQYVEERYATDLIAVGHPRLGYLLKDRVADVTEFVEAVRRVGRGRHGVGPRGGVPAARPQPAQGPARCADAAGEPT
jgi:hypothetical protein